MLNDPPAREVHQGLNATADSFYSSQGGAVQGQTRVESASFQRLKLKYEATAFNIWFRFELAPLQHGRTGGDFDDRNETLIDALLEAQPSATTLEMETFHLLDLARCSKKVGGVKAGGGGRARQILLVTSSKFRPFPRRP